MLRLDLRSHRSSSSETSVSSKLELLEFIVSVDRLERFLLCLFDEDDDEFNLFDFDELYCREVELVLLFNLVFFSL